MQNSLSEQSENVYGLETSEFETPKGVSFLEKLKTKWPVILGAFGSIAIFSAIIYVAYSYGNRGHELQPTLTIIPTPMPTLELISTVVQTPPPGNQTEEWKTYTNNEMNFSFRYPEEFSLQAFPKLTVSDLPTVIVRIEHTKIQDYPSISLAVAETDMSIEQWIESNDYCPNTFDSCTAIVSGPIFGSTQFQSINRHYGSIDTLVKKSDIVFNFSLGAKKPNQPPEQNESQLYNQILQTFKFLSECKSGFLYYDEEFFSICYPEYMRLESRDRDTKDTKLVGESVVVKFRDSDKKRSLIIDSDFLGAWAGGACQSSESTTVSGYTATRFIWEKQEGSVCEGITQFATAIPVPGQERGSYMIWFSQIDGIFSDSSEYDTIEQSLKIKKF